MTFAPPTLVTLGKYLVSRGAENLGIKGDAAHVTAGTSYHLGADQLKPGAYSAQLPRDVAGLTNAASAIDVGKVGGTLAGLRELSNWLVKECANRAIDTLDLREVIYSPDGIAVQRWSGVDNAIHTGSGNGDLSHRWHTHVSWFRDAEFRDHSEVFRRYFEEADVTVKQVKGEEWKPTVTNGTSNGVFRERPDRAAPIVERVGVDVVIRSIAEIDANGLSWRLTERMGRTLYMLRTDWVPLVQGGDPAVDALLDDFIAGRDPAPPIDCTPLVNAARAEGVAAGLRDGSRAVKAAAVNAAVLLGG